MPAGVDRLPIELHYDRASGTVRISDVRFDEAGRFFATLLHVFGGSRLASLLQSHLVFHEQAQIGRLERQITNALATPQGTVVQTAADIRQARLPALPTGDATGTVPPPARPVAPLSTDTPPAEGDELGH